MFQTLGYVALGGALGSVARAGVSHWVVFPFGTLAVNVLGSLLIGLAFGAGLAERSAAHAVLMVGVLGGFTTFSTFSLDTLKLVQGGQMGAALAYVAASLLLSLGAVALGFVLSGSLS